jgi:hypothetical protein
MCVDPKLLIRTEYRMEEVLPIVLDCPDSFRIIALQNLSNQVEFPDVEVSGAECCCDSESKLEGAPTPQDESGIGTLNPYTVRVMP